MCSTTGPIEKKLVNLGFSFCICIFTMQFIYCIVLLANSELMQYKLSNNRCHVVACSDQN